jgi:hypothetical protein
LTITAGQASVSVFINNFHNGIDTGGIPWVEQALRAASPLPCCRDWLALRDLRDISKKEPDAS